MSECSQCGGGVVGVCGHPECCRCGTPGGFCGEPMPLTFEEGRDIDVLAEYLAPVLSALIGAGSGVSMEVLNRTPMRWAKALVEMTAGHEEDPAEILRVFDVPEADEMVVIRGIEFASLCEHHCLPFSGVAHVAYIPDGRVVGLSKIPRLVHCFARRLQVQERLTAQIARALMDDIRPLGVGVMLAGHHSCMALRGVRSSGEMVTSSLLGVFRQPEVRAEFFALVAG